MSAQQLQFCEILDTNKSYLGLKFILNQDDDAVSCECLYDFMRNCSNTNYTQPLILFNILHYLMKTEKYLMASQLISEYVIDIPVQSDSWLHVKKQCLSSHMSSASRFLQLLTPIEERQLLLRNHSGLTNTNQTNAVNAL